MKNRGKKDFPHFFLSIRRPLSHSQDRAREVFIEFLALCCYQWFQAPLSPNQGYNWMGKKKFTASLIICQIWGSSPIHLLLFTFEFSISCFIYSVQALQFESNRVKCAYSILPRPGTPQSHLFSILECNGNLSLLISQLNMVCQLYSIIFFNIHVILSCVTV